MGAGADRACGGYNVNLLIAERDTGENGSLHRHTSTHPGQSLKTEDPRMVSGNKSCTH